MIDVNQENYFQNSIFHVECDEKWSPTIKYQIFDSTRNLDAWKINEVDLL